MDSLNDTEMNSFTHRLSSLEVKIHVHVKPLCVTIHIKSSGNYFHVSNRTVHRTVQQYYNFTEILSLWMKP